jgi:hypothetical protein
VRINYLLLSFLCLCVSVYSKENINWPSIEPVSKSFNVDFKEEKVVIDLPVYDVDEKPTYHFACRGVKESYLDKLNQNWVGPLMCTLALGNIASEVSLLSEDDSAAWFSRGQFSRKDLTGKCAAYPQFGAHRTFRLRGFQLTLDAQNIKTDSSKYAVSFVLNVDIQPDQTALSPQAEQSGYLRPALEDKNCENVLKGYPKRMCRDWENKDGSWGECKE